MSGGMESDDACGGCGLFFKAPEFASAPGISDRAPVRAVSEGLKGGKPDRNRPKVGRNDPCPCGSGKKYKNCCGRNQ